MDCDDAELEATKQHNGCNRRTKDPIIEETLTEIQTMVDKMLE